MTTETAESTEIKRVEPSAYPWAIRNEGAFLALLALNNALDGAHIAHTKEQYVAFVNSLVGMLLMDYRARDEFLCSRGECEIVVDADTCEVQEIRAPHGQEADE